MDVPILLAKLYYKLPEFTSLLIFNTFEFPKLWNNWKIKWQIQN